jgi:microcystin-dependent protein
MDGYIGEIVIVAFDFAPRGWACCDGQLLPVATNMPLFSLLGFTYGGDGRTNFALPDLRGRVPVGYGRSVDNTTDLGEKTGAEHADVTLKQLNTESQKVLMSEPAPKNDSNILVTMPRAKKPVEIMQPYIVANYIIALIGIFPSRV